MSTTTKSVQVLPPNFSFSPDDPFYFGNATCELLHYRTSAYLAAAVEFIMLVVASAGFWQFYHVNEAMDRWLMVAVLALLAFSVVTSAFMFYGLHTEQTRLIYPKIAFIQIEIGILIMGAVIAVVAMSVGIEMTNALFSIFVKVPVMERDFGPIWPFNVAVVSFFSAAIGIWLQVLVRGAYDYLLDKEYFTTAPSIEMEKTLPKPE